METIVCPSCTFTFPKDFLYCPHCGKSVQEMLGVPVGKQISVYAVSLLLPPFGLVPGIKYLFSKNGNVKRVGLIAIILTIVSIVVTIWMTGALVSQINTSLNSQLQQYAIPGY